MDGDKQMKLRYAGMCSLCGEEIPQGIQAFYNTSARTVRHIDCDAEIDRGVAGASARREHERRRARDDAKVAEQKAGVQAVFGTGFVGGAVGEERVAEFLDQLGEVGVVALHDRRIPGTRANIDHIAITPWGVWVIDAKRYLNKRPDAITEGGFFGVGGTLRLTVGGRKHDELVDGVLRQTERVMTVVGDAVTVRGALAFVDADWPLVGGNFTIRGVAVLWPRRLAKLLLRQEPPTVDVEGLVRQIAAKFPAA